MGIYKAYKFRIYPTKQQEVLLAKHFGCVRFVYNYFLNERKKFYLENKEEIEAKRIKGDFSYIANARKLTELKKELDWLFECNNQSLQVALKQLDSAYKMFFRKTHQFPQFKSKHDKQSFKITARVNIKDQRLYIPKFLEGIKIKQHRDLNGRFISAAVSKTTTNKYYLSITQETDIELAKTLEAQIGIDLGIKDLITCSDGQVYSNIKSLKKLEPKLKYKQKQLSKKVKGGKNRIKAKLKVALIHEKIKNRRLDHIHKITKSIVSENQVIIAEDLNVKGMMANHKLAKSISDVSWSEITRQLKYKSSWKGRTYHEIDRWFPSSKTCNSCGCINQSLQLKERNWTCISCNTNLDRDLNAAQNILNQGLNELNAARIVV